MVRVTELKYSPDSSRYVDALRGEPWLAFLDSASAALGQGRYDVVAADPSVVLTTRGASTEIRTRAGSRLSYGDPLALVREALGPAAAPFPGLPFTGGAIGYFAYDLGRRFERLETRAAADIDMPELAVGIYDWAVVVDHAAQRAWLVEQGRDERTAARAGALCERLEAAAGARRAERPFEVLSAVRSSFSRDEYERAFARVKAHIAAGDCYQVNLTQRFEAEARGDAWAAYRRLRRDNPAPYSAFLDLPFGTVLSSSPERFLRVEGRHVTTEPIKGTRPRSPDPAADRALADELAASAKDRAENVMIVDLLRNDLGRTCAPGSIRPARLFAVESFASVHHLVSTIEGDLAPAADALDLLRGCFPGGSITGAPKLRAMQVIEALEPQRRSVYCGAIGYLGFDGNMDTSIAIRTLVHCNDTIYAWAGGGVVADSEAESEYRESLDKASALLALLDRRVGLAS